eukprot:CAMPEP_0203941428 /NCGR_PEP_ID=MMETSP0359-20131031/77805_1 /ASSEMBLY_ACC=CAM_ASM_000338 /TAXON_ID=268821 /ORGANISM="Scrippsiella Hangoei, Strain SHTV-5" /LENGTH=99 /DNA_ID=CAMNT_0050871983 /DNA_START=9 /DNA_END=308 /DNA_ORIENTATION=+
MYSPFLRSLNRPSAWRLAELFEPGSGRAEQESARIVDPRYTSWISAEEARSQAAPARPAAPWRSTATPRPSARAAASAEAEASATAAAATVWDRSEAGV